MAVSSNNVKTVRAPQASESPWHPFRYAAFTVVWVTTVISNIGGAMYNAAAGWLMTSLNPTPLAVSLVQVVTTLPIFLFALPAGALADIVQKRQLLIVVETATMVVAFIFSILVWLNRVTPEALLGFTFVLGVGSALAAPAWQAIVPQLVPRTELPSAITLNSAGFNVSRAIGPALGGLITAGFSIAAPFWMNALSSIGIVGALIWWKGARTENRHLPSERFVSAMLVGIRYARHNSHLRATLMRASGFFFCASAYWALLPLVARDRLAGGAEVYGWLLGAIGVGAVAGAVALPSLKPKTGPNQIAALSAIGTAVALTLYAFAQNLTLGVVASLIAGLAWIAAISSFNVSAQIALPDWVRGRGLAVYATIFFGAMTLGGMIWGHVASALNLQTSLVLSAVATISALLLTLRWKLQTAAGINLTPSMHWPVPVMSRTIDEDRGPVLVLVTYRIMPECRSDFLEALAVIAKERRRDGAYDWNVFEDASDSTVYIETFYVDSWIEHLRQHERVTHADRLAEESILAFTRDKAPQITHLIAAKKEDYSPSGSIR